MQFNMFFKKEMYQKYVDGDSFESMNKNLDKSLSMRFPQKLYRIIASISDSANTIELRYNGGILDTIKLSDYYANERGIILWHALGGHIAHWISTSPVLPKRIQSKKDIKLNNSYDSVKHLLFFNPTSYELPLYHTFSCMGRIRIPTYAVGMMSFEPWAMPAIPFEFVFKLGLTRYILDESNFNSIIADDTKKDIQEMFDDNLRILYDKHEEILKALDLKL